MVAYSGHGSPDPSRPADLCDQVSVGYGPSAALGKASSRLPHGPLGRTLRCQGASCAPCPLGNPTGHERRSWRNQREIPFTTNDRKPNRPSHPLFLVQGENDDAVWTEVGALWPTRTTTGST